MEIKTFIFFDLETTGLFSDRYFPSPALKKSTNPQDFTTHLERALVNIPRANDPQITELSFIAVDRNVFVKAGGRVNDNFQGANGNSTISTNLSCNVFTRLVKPSMNEEEWKAYEGRRATVPALKYSKDDLALMKNFKTIWQEVKDFLEQLPKPACLVAHNGLGYDLRVLYSELKRNDMMSSDETSIFKEIRFIDSLLAFSNIEEMHKNDLTKLQKGLKGGQLTIDDLLDANNNLKLSPGVLRRWVSSNFEETSNGTWNVKTTSRKRKSFKLENLFNDIVKGSCDFHRAQDDTEALIQICLGYGEDFIKYLDSASARIPFQFIPFLSQQLCK